MTIHGKVVEITGASSGIGEATARHLATSGAAVVLGARRTDRLDRLTAEIEAAGGRAVATRVDLTDPGDLRALVDLAVERFGRLDVLVGNAGISRRNMAELGVDPEAVVRAIAFAIDQPGDVEIGDPALRPTRQC
ncbi:SDR family oxidoreductase [Nocardia rhamnosiphila]|uniref:SDR family oxidoreductase n=1 Tax=Nocardia rhamnosiphila TaxID=426716 RepID=UPI00378BDBE4